MSTLDTLLNTRNPKMTPDDMRAACSGPIVTPSFDLFGHLLEKYGPTMTPNDASEVLRCHPSHVRELLKVGELPAVKIGNRWRIPTARLAEMLEGGE